MADAAGFVKLWIDLAVEDFDGWFDDMASSVRSGREAEAAAFLAMAAARLGFRTEESKLELFSRAQDAGVHIMPVHFYSPVPDTRAIGAEVWAARYDHLPGLEIETPAIVTLLRDLGQFGHELAEVVSEPQAGQYYWGNPAFNGGDASLLYAMIRKLRPENIVEIGSGYSTLMGLKALKQNEHGRYLCIEPFPSQQVRDLAEAGQIDLIAEGVQAVPLSTFDRLGSGDILFIDSTHVAKTGSDVVHEVLRILPRLNPGVVVHVHDIFHPYEYSQDWVEQRGIFWNEQYLLLALLCENPRFEVLIPNYACVGDPTLKAAHAEAFPFSPVQGGGSFWFRRSSVT